MASSASNDIQSIILDICREEIELLLSPECCIYRVPESLRKENNDAYTPLLISIGPIHHNDAQTKPMEKQKLIYLDYFRKRLKLKDLRDYTTYLGEKEEEIRKCYSEKYPDLDKVKFIRMILLDSVFIMELFLRKSEGEHDDYMFKKSWLSKSVERDLLLLENQLPFFVLEELYNHVTDDTRASFLQLARKYFIIYDPYPKIFRDEINDQNILKQGWDKPKHFTDLIRYFYVPGDLTIDDSSTSAAPVIKTAKKLQGAGISFEPISNRCLLDVRFQKSWFLYWLPWMSSIPFLKCVKARFQLPKLRLYDTTESAFRNLMAFEQCHYPKHHYICSYVALLDYLIQTEEDVDVLVESKVMVHELGSDKDLAGLINNLSKHVVINSTCYGTQANELDKHYHNRWNYAVAQLRLVYFRDLWRGGGTIVGLAVLFFTFYNFFSDVL